MREIHDNGGSIFSACGTLSIRTARLQDRAPTESLDNRRFTRQSTGAASLVINTGLLSDLCAMSVTATDPNLKHLQSHRANRQGRSQECGTDAEQRPSSGPGRPGCSCWVVCWPKSWQYRRGAFEALVNLFLSPEWGPGHWSWHCCWSGKTNLPKPETTEKWQPLNPRT